MVDDFYNEFSKNIQKRELGLKNESRKVYKP
jgi:hypothetical protein